MSRPTFITADLLPDLTPDLNAMFPKHKDIKDMSDKNMGDKHLMDKNMKDQRDRAGRASAAGEPEQSATDAWFSVLPPAP